MEVWTVENKSRSRSRLGQCSILTVKKESIGSKFGINILILVYIVSVFVMDMSIPRLLAFFHSINV
jgi:hypothetical protein